MMCCEKNIWKLVFYEASACIHEVDGNDILMMQMLMIFVMNLIKFCRKLFDEI